MEPRAIRLPISGIGGTGLARDLFSAAHALFRQAVIGALMPDASLTTARLASGLITSSLMQMRIGRPSSIVAFDVVEDRLETPETKMLVFGGLAALVSRRLGYCS